TTVIASCADTGAPRNGYWRMITPSGRPGYDSNFTVEMFSLYAAKYERTSSREWSMTSGMTYGRGAGGTPMSSDTGVCAATTVSFGGSSATMACCSVFISAYVVWPSF